MEMRKQGKQSWKKIVKKIFRKRKNMMGQGDISGTWFNPRTGQTVTARQIISDGDQTFVQTDQGMIDMNDFSQFVQMGEEEFTERVDQAVFSAENMEIINKQKNQFQEDLLNKPLSNKTLSNKPLENVSTPSTIEVETKQVKNINDEILDRAFAKIEGTPRITNIEIDWDGLPLEKIKSMIDLMDLSVADVSKYILKKYFKTTNIIENKITKELI